VTEQKQVSLKPKAATTSPTSPTSDRGGKSIETIITVARTVKVNGTDETSEVTQEVIDVRKFATTPAMIRFDQKINPSREYQSCGYTIGIDLPCYVEEIDQGFDKAKEFVLAKSRELFKKNEEVLGKLVEMKRSAEGR